MPIENKSIANQRSMSDPKIRLRNLWTQRQSSFINLELKAQLKSVARQKLSNVQTEALISGCQGQRYKSVNSSSFDIKLHSEKQLRLLVMAFGKSFLSVDEQTLRVILFDTFSGLLFCESNCAKLAIRYKRRRRGKRDRKNGGYNCKSICRRYPDFGITRDKKIGELTRKG